jgi:glycogen debranching enzyme
MFRWMAVLVGVTCLLPLQCVAAIELKPLPRFPILNSHLAIIRNTEPAKPFTVAGEHGAIFGQQNGECEAWIFPTKIFSQLQITAELADYPVPIDLNAQPGSIEVNPGHTTITYSHAAFTVRQHMFSPRGNGSAPVVFFEIAAIRPLQLTFRFAPIVQRMWPAANFGRPSAEWVASGNSGYYVLHTDNDQISAAIAIPRATPGILQPYQERPKTYPVELKLNFDPAKDEDLFFPLLMASGTGNEALGQQLLALDESIPELYAATSHYYQQLLDKALQVESPDKRFDQALQWAIVSIDQMQVLHGATESGLVGGYYSSGDSARPGFGWFFGRDTLWTLYAVNAYGGFDLARRALEFLFKRQRADGKIMHEYSQTADLVDWNALPYFYAAADATPLLLMALEDYVSVSGDVAFLRQHWDAAQRAYGFMRQHDSDHDGIYENTEGTGWVEAWPPRMPHQEIYLAALDQQGTESMSRLAGLLGDASLSFQATAVAATIRRNIESEYFDSKNHFYAFSRNADGSTDTTATIFPAVAWWTGWLSLPKADEMLSRWAAQEFSTDWGTRDVSGREKIFDPISYHQGSVWPLFTGWVSLAEFRAGRPLSGTTHLYQNLGLTYTQDLGAVTEVLSGMFFQPLGRSSSHQLWSSAMVLSPALRGLLGLDFDAVHKTLRLAPHLPATWDRVRLHRVPFGDLRLEIEMVRNGGVLAISANASAPSTFCLTTQTSQRETRCEHPVRSHEQLTLPLPGVEVELPEHLPEPGAATKHVKVVEEKADAHEFAIVLEGPAGTTQLLNVRRNRGNVTVEGGAQSGSNVLVTFPPGSGIQRQRISFHW